MYTRKASLEKLIVLAFLLSGCGASTSVPPTATSLPPSATPVPPTSTMKPEPATSTLTPIPTAEPGSKVIGSIQNGANVPVALIPQGADRIFIVEVDNDTPQVLADKTGHFEFGDVPPNLYIIVSPLKDGGFQLYGPPLDSSLIASHLPEDIWAFQKGSDADTDLGSLRLREGAVLRPFDPQFPITLSPLD